MPIHPPLGGILGPFSMPSFLVLCMWACVSAWGLAHRAKSVRLDRAPRCWNSRRSSAMQEEIERVARVFFSFCSSLLRVNKFPFPFKLVCRCLALPWSKSMRLGRATLLEWIRIWVTSSSRLEAQLERTQGWIGHWDNDKQCYASDHVYVTMCTIPMSEPCSAASMSQTESLRSSDVARAKCTDIMFPGWL